MPDAGEPRRDECTGGTPAGWGDAFAALPMATPDGHAWQRLQARLPEAAARHSRWPVWLAVAASLALAVVLPLRFRQAPPIESIASDPAPQVAVVDTVPSEVAQAATGQGTAPPAMGQAAPAGIPARVAREGRKRPLRLAPSQRPIRTVAVPAGTPRLATANHDADRLEPLYAESAQLEGLLALARDDQVAAGSGAALVDALDQRVAGIDGALADPTLDPGLRARLWGERVETLRQLVGIETTQRLLSARGENYDAALVSID